MSASTPRGSKGMSTRTSPRPSTAPGRSVSTCTSPHPTPPGRGMSISTSRRRNSLEKEGLAGKKKVNKEKKMVRPKKAKETRTSGKAGIKVHKKGKLKRSSIGDGKVELAKKRKATRSTGDVDVEVKKSGR